MDIRCVSRCCKPSFALLIASLCLTAAHSEALELQIAPGAGARSLGRTGSGKSSIYKPGWIDLNKDGIKNVYEDASQPVEKRVGDLLGRMTNLEKMGQLWPGPTKAEHAKAALIAKGGLGSFREIPGVELRNSLQKAAVEDSRLGIPLLFGFEPARASSGPTPVSGAAPDLIQPVGLRISKDPPNAKLDDEVRVILRAKFVRGLFEQPYIQCKPACDQPCKGV